MRIGIHSFSMGPALKEQIQVAVDAERHALDCVWYGQIFSRDALTLTALPETGDAAFAAACPRQFELRVHLGEQGQHRLAIGAEARGVGVDACSPAFHSWLLSGCGLTAANRIVGAAVRRTQFRGGGTELVALPYNRSTIALGGVT